MTSFSAFSRFPLTVVASALALTVGGDHASAPEPREQEATVVTVNTDDFRNQIHAPTEDLKPVPPVFDSADFNDGIGIDPFLSDEDQGIQPAVYAIPEFTKSQIQLASGSKENRDDALRTALDGLVKELGEQAWYEVLKDNTDTSKSENSDFLHTVSVLENLSSGLKEEKHSKEFVNAVLDLIGAMSKEPIFGMKTNPFMGSSDTVATEALRFFNKVLDAKARGVIPEAPLMSFIQETKPLVNGASFKSVPQIIDSAFKLAGKILLAQRDSGNISNEQANEYWKTIGESPDHLSAINEILSELKPIPTNQQELTELLPVD